MCALCVLFSISLSCSLYPTSHLSAGLCFFLQWLFAFHLRLLNENKWYSVAIVRPHKARQPTTHLRLYAMTSIHSLSKVFWSNSFLCCPVLDFGHGASLLNGEWKSNVTLAPYYYAVRWSKFIQFSMGCSVRKQIKMQINNSLNE